MTRRTGRSPWLNAPYGRSDPYEYIADVCRVALNRLARLPDYDDSLVWPMPQSFGHRDDPLINLVYEDSKMQNAKVGDTVHVKGVVVAEKDEDGELQVCIPRVHACRHASVKVYMDPSAIVHVEPRELQVGDVVSGMKYGYTYTIRALHGGKAWLQRVGEAIFITANVSDLQRV